MISNNYKTRMLKQLDELNEQPKRQTYGRQPPMKKQVKRNNNLPTNMIFFNEDTGETYPLNQNGAVQFLQKMNVPTAQQNVDWVIDSLINTSIDDTIDLNGYNIGISCECSYDPQGRSLAEMGIAKSMLIRPTSRPPMMNGQYQQQSQPMQKEQSHVICQIPNFMGGGYLVSGEGVYLGKDPMEIMKAKRKEFYRPPENSAGFNNTPHVAKMKDVSQYMKEWNEE